MRLATLVWMSLVLSVAVDAEVVLYDFYADWCGPCRAMVPVLDRLEQRGVPIVRINVDERPDLARAYGVEALPTFVVVRDGRIVARHVGAASEEQLMALVERASAARQPNANSDRQSPDRDELLRYLLSVSVRMYRQTGGARYYGSGTIISSTEAEAIILTCAHLFRSSQGLGQSVFVEWFGTDPPKVFRGRLIARDRNADLALVRVKTDRMLPAAKVGVAGLDLRPGVRLYSVGCDRGSRPQIYPTRLTAVNRYVGPPNFEILGAPRQGRSGGGLFTEDGYLVGVCSAADPYGNRGLFAALGAVHHLLAAARLEHLYAPGSGDRSVAASDQQPEVRFAKQSATPPVGASLSLPSPEQLQVGSASASTRIASLDPPASAAAAVDDSDGEGVAEIVCVIRPLGGPEEPSRVIVVRRAPKELVQLLESHARKANLQQTTDRSNAPSPRLGSQLEHNTAAGAVHWRPAGRSRSVGVSLLAPDF